MDAESQGSENCLILPIPRLILSLAIKCELVECNQKCKEKSQSPSSFPHSLYMRLRTENMAAAFRHILNKSEASNSVSVILIHTRSEDTSDSVSIASVASLNQA